MVGLPIFGDIYEEYVPSDRELFRYSNERIYRSSLELRNILYKYDSDSEFADNTSHKIQKLANQPYALGLTNVRVTLRPS